MENNHGENHCEQEENLAYSLILGKQAKADEDLLLQEFEEIQQNSESNEMPRSLTVLVEN